MLPEEDTPHGSNRSRRETWHTPPTIRFTAPTREARNCVWNSSLNYQLFCQGVDGWGEGDEKEEEEGGGGGAGG